MSAHQTTSDFQFDPSDYPAFKEKVRSAANMDPFADLALKEVIIHSEAIYDLPAVLHRTAPDFKQALVVMDKTPMVRDQVSLKPLISQILTQGSYQVTTIILEGDHFGVVHPDFEQVEVVHKQIQPGAVVIGLGSGVVADICKYACFLYDNEHNNQPPVPLISIPTANSVPAYSSSLAIISKDGVKRTWRTRLPNVILCDLKILLDCPHSLTLGGIGDMCAMYIASLEWFMGIYMEVIPDSPASRAILDEARPLLIQSASEIGKQTLTGMQMLAKILTLGGLAMAFAGDSTPMSGYEHGIAHLLDMSAEHFHRPVRNHGSQVAVAGILVMLGFEEFFKKFNPAAVDVEQCYLSEDEMKNKIMKVFAEIDPTSKMGAECWRDYQKKLVIWKNVRPGFEKLLAEWDQIKPKMESLTLPAETYTKMLHEAGHPLTFEELGIQENQARWAYQNAYMLRKRLSTTDLMIFMDWMDQTWVDDIFSKAQSLVNRVQQNQQ